jgi:hypothetical protein
VTGACDPAVGQVRQAQSQIFFDVVPAKAGIHKTRAGEYGCRLSPA